MRSLLSRGLATTALVALAALAAPALAEDRSGPNAGPAAEGAAAGAVARMALAQSLYDAGVADGDALTVLTAARLAAQVGLQDGSREVEQAPVEGAELLPDADSGLLPPDAAAMFAKARELAGDDELLIGLIEDAEAEGARGRIGGALRYLSRLPARHTDTYRIPFYGGVLAELAIVGDGDADLDMVLTDENGNVICYDVSPSDKVYCSWTPIWNGNFFLVVENVGRKRNSYYLLTN